MSAMKRFTQYSEVAAHNGRPRVVTIGNFDGVHIGHQAVLRAARKEALRLGLELAVLTFDPHPAEILKPGHLKLRLVAPERKAALLEACGVDLALFQKFDRAFAALSAETFAREVLAEALHTRLVFVGGNFRFGRGREAGVEQLTRLGQKLGFDVYGEPLIRASREEVSSSRIRRCLLDGDVDTARELLGRCHEVHGTVTRGREMGAKIGFPTINLRDFTELQPGPGIYAALCDFDGRAHPAAAYIGNRPTLNAGFSVEAHLLDFDEDLYGKRVALRFVTRIRDDEKFEDTGALVRQITADVARIREVLEETHA
jgi:riboflavin kinase/FMN adenylyltransferase